MASLFVIQGVDQGKRFVLRPQVPAALGRDAANAIRLHDGEVSRRHAEVRPDDGRGFRIVDLGSANGTYVNDRLISEAPLRGGDRVQIGQTVLLFTGDAASADDLTERVDLLARASPQDRSAIVRSLSAEDGSRVLTAPGEAGAWLKARLAHFSVLYQATQAISHILDPDELLPQILQLVFESVGADRGAILLIDESGALAAKAVRWRDQAEPGERLTISQTIVERVRETGEAVVTTDASTDDRFSPSQSIADYAIREAICVPIRGRHTTLGVLYADALGDVAALAAPGAAPRTTRFTQEHLMLMVAIGHQAGLAIENTQLLAAKLRAERLAAAGETIATLSHHIKNILQGLRGGSYLIDQGLQNGDDSTVRRGWAVVEKNQNKIYHLVTDMLSFCKDREPTLDRADLNATVADVVELMQPRANELNVALNWHPDPTVPEIWIDPEAIHRAVLNLVINALEACEDIEGARVAVATRWDAERGLAIVTIEDNGVGIAPEDLPSVFQAFASTKGARGTGLGLPVAEKIVREHGGRVSVDSQVGRGTCFVVELPRYHADEDVAPGDPLATMT